MSTISATGGIDGQSSVTQTDLDMFQHQMPLNGDVEYTSIDASYNGFGQTDAYDFSGGVLSLGATMGDATTGNGSGARSELREENNWALGDGSHTMATTYSVPQEAHGTPTTIGQIMNETADGHVPMVRIEHQNGQLEVVIRSQPGLGGADVHIPLNDTAIQAGEQFQVGMDVNDQGQLTMTLHDAQGNSILSPDAESQLPVDLSGWIGEPGEGAYFKAGVYHSDRDTANGTRAAVDIHDLDISHGGAGAPPPPAAGAAPPEATEDNPVTMPEAPTPTAETSDEAVTTTAVPQQPMNAGMMPTTTNMMMPAMPLLPEMTPGFITSGNTGSMIDYLFQGTDLSTLMTPFWPMLSMDTPSAETPETVFGNPLM